MNTCYFIKGWIVVRAIAMCILFAASITGCTEQVAGVGTGGTGGNTIAMGGSVQGKALALKNEVTTIAGNATTVAGTAGSADGTGAEARFSSPSNITSDGTNLYVTDSGNGTIRMIVIATGTVTTLAGTAGTWGGWADGIGPVAIFDNIRGITTDGTNLYVADFSHTIRKIVIATGEVTTLAGSAFNAGAVDGIGSTARFYYPSGITTDGTNLYVTDSLNSTIRKIVIATGDVSTLAGAAGAQGTTDGTGTAARFYQPSGITTDGTNLYVADSGNNPSIRKIVIATGAVTTLAGGIGSFNGITTDGSNLYVSLLYRICKIEISSGNVTVLAGSTTPGAVNSSGVAASFGAPAGLTMDGTNLYVVDANNNSIRKVVISNGAVTTLAGAAEVDGTGATASFFSPFGITTDGANLYVTDSDSNTIRKVVIATGAVTTLAGSANIWGATDGIGSVASFYRPQGITTGGTFLYVADGNSVIRKIEISTSVVTTLAGSANNWGATDGIGTAARFFGPTGITTDGTNLYVTDNCTIRKIEIATGTVTTLAGTAGIIGSDDGTGAAARFSDQLIGITTDGTNLYVADLYTIRKIVISTGVVTTLAGSAVMQGTADGIGASASFYVTKGITTDGTNLYVTDAIGTIRKVVISTGVVTTIAGKAYSSGSSDGTGVEARFRTPDGITTDGTNLYVVDTGNNIIRKIQ
jgi:hypothetical protein